MFSCFHRVVVSAVSSIGHFVHMVDCSPLSFYSLLFVCSVHVFYGSGLLVFCQWMRFPSPCRPLHSNHSHIPQLTTPRNHKTHPPTNSSPPTYHPLPQTKPLTKPNPTGDKIAVHYKGTLAADGSEFDASYNRGQPLTFHVGKGQVIKGWDQGLLDMCPGEARRLTIQPEWAYGSRGMGPIPAESVLSEFFLFLLVSFVFCFSLLFLLG